ncbi:hypothetical protein D9M71_742420 [compost metagenome]
MVLLLEDNLLLGHSYFILSFTKWVFPLVVAMIIVWTKYGGMNNGWAGQSDLNMQLVLTSKMRIN